MKKNDKILAAAVIILAAAIFLAGSYMRKEGEMVSVYVSDALYGQYRLKDNQTVEIHAGEGKTNLLVIQNGSASVTEATCPDLLCVHQRSISQTGENIVCLPNKVVVRIDGGTANTDAVLNP